LPVNTPFLPMLLAISALALAFPATAQTLERGNGPEPSTLDATLGQDVSGRHILRGRQGGPDPGDARGRLSPGMAGDWQLSADGRTWTFRLRDNLAWSNGEPLVAAQIVASFRRAFAPATAAPFAVHFDAIENASAVQQGKLPPERLGIVATDARTLQFRVSRSVALPQLLLLPIAYPVYLPAVSQHGAQHTRPGHLVSNGAYRLDAWRPQAQVTVVRNPHFRAPAPIPRVRHQVHEDAASAPQPCRPPPPGY